MSTPVLGRNARLLKGGDAIGYGKNISVKASAEIIKAYSTTSKQNLLLQRMHRRIILGLRGANASRRDLQMRRIEMIK